jgi:chromosome segregation ATPase
MKKICVIAAAFALVISGTNVYAQEDATNVRPGAIGATVKTPDGKTRPARPDDFEIRTVETGRAPVRAEINVLKAEAKAISSSSKANLKESRDSIKSEIESRKQDLKAKGNASSTIATKIQKTLDKSSDRLTKELARFREIQAKIETRLAKLDAEGASSTQARIVLASAITKLSQAETSIKALATLEISKDDPRSSTEAVKTAIMAAQEALKAGHKALMDVLPSMKGLQAGIKRQNDVPKASSTPATTTGTTTI